MSQEPFSFLAKVSNPVRQIVYNTILSDLPPMNKCNILWFALEHDEARHILEKELVSRERKVWQTLLEEAFSGLNERAKSILLQAINKQEASECKQLLLQYPQDHSRNLLESWYNNVKDDDAIYHRIFEGMKHQLCQLPEQGQEAIVVLNSQTPEAGWDSHCGSRDKEVEPNSAQVEKIYWEKSGAVETISATNSNHNRFKTYVARGNEIGFDRSSIQGQGFRNIVERQTAERTTNSFDYEVSNLSFFERFAAASAHFDRNHPSISPSPSSKAQVQYYRPSEGPTLADQCPGIGYQPSQQHVGQNSSGIDHGVSYTVNAVRASVDLGNVPLSEEHSGAGYEKNYGEEILNETGDNIGYPNVVQTIDPDLKSPALSEPSSSHSLNSQPDQSSLQHEQDTGQETRIKQDFGTDEVPQEDIYNVLLLGETGVGKTTFINSCANYIKFNTMEEALAVGPEILMNSTFTASEAVGTVKITVLATTGETGAKNSTNEHSEQAGESRTQEPLIHKMTWFAENKRRKLLRIIDTPGVNDTRGQDQDAVNFKKVLHLIQRIGKLHAICLLLKPNESVMSVGFRRSLDYFLTKLHSSALKNILFCFTNTRSTFYLPGETYTLLETYFKDLKAANGIEITLNLSNVFCFENDCFRYMCLLMNDRNRLNQHHKQVAKSWEHNVPEIRKFLDRIQLLNPHLTEDTTNMDTVSELLSELARPLMETMQSLVNNQDQVVRLKEKIKKSTHSEAELRNLMHTKMVVLRKQFLPQPRLICTTIKCSQELYLNDGTLVYEPGKACHDPCHFPQLIRDRQNQQMASCPIFSRKGVCTKCHCPKAYHQYIGYKLYHDTEDIIREDVRQRLEECTSETERQKLMLDNLNKTLDQLNSEINAIKSACTEFSTFLLYSSLKAGADPYSIYLDILIRNEKDKQTGNELRYKLEDILNRHNLDVQRNFQNVRTGQQLKLTYDQINTKIAFLCSLQSSGRLISEIVEGVARSGGSNGDK